MNTIKYIFATVLCVVVLFPFVFSVGDSQEFPITTNESDQRSPAIYGDIVVYEDNRNGNWDIYGYNLEKKEEFQITKDLEDQLNPAIYQDIVVYEDHGIIKDDTSGFTFESIISGYNLSTQEEFQIITTPYWKPNPAWTDNPVQKSHPAIYGDIVVWIDDGIGHAQLVGYNLETHEAFKVSEIPGIPAIYETIVVWQDYTDHIFIYGYNTSTKEEFKIGTEDRFLFPIYFRKNPAIHTDIVVWTESDDNIIYGYSLTTQEEFLIGTASMNECPPQYRFARPRIYNDIVIWVDCRNGNRDIYGYSLQTDEEFQVTTHESRQLSPALYENIVVWEDDRNENWDIYGADISSPLVITPKSKTRIMTDFIFDFFETYAVWAFYFGVLIVLVVLFVFNLVRGIRYWRAKKVGDISKAPSPVKPKDLERNALLTVPSILFAVFFVILGYLVVFNLESFFGFFYFALTAFCAIYYFWSKRTPYIRITTDGIMLLKFMRNPTVISLGGIKKMDVKMWRDMPYRIDLLLSDDTKENITDYERLKISLLPLNEKDKEELIQTLK